MRRSPQSSLVFQRRLVEKIIYTFAAWPFAAAGSCEPLIFRIAIAERSNRVG